MSLSTKKVLNERLTHCKWTQFQYSMSEAWLNNQIEYISVYTKFRIQCEFSDSS